MLRQVAKLRGRSADELRVRSTQLLRVAAERLRLAADVSVPTDAEFLRSGLTPGPHSASPGALLDAFRRRAAEGYLPGLVDPSATVAAVRDRCPAQEAEILRRAKEILEGRFQLLGRTGLTFGDPIDWGFDPVSGKRTGLAHWSRIEHLDPEQAGEYKVTWELNRHQYFLTLGEAFHLTADERYARCFAEHLAAWTTANPPKRGINWSSSLELAYRSIAWAWALHCFREARALSAPLFLRALKFVHLQAQHVERFLSTYFSPNTHLTGEALGLYSVGCALPELQGSESWREAGRRILLEQIERHVRPDGVYFEQSTYYHRYTADIYLHFAALADARGEALPASALKRLTLLLEHLVQIARADGTTPLIGDDDGGRLLPLAARAPDDFRDTLCTGAVLLRHPHFRFAAGELAPETVWLLGPSAVQAWEEVEAAPPAERSQAFPDGGVYVMRSGWEENADRLIIDGGPHGVLNCGHAHADALAIELALEGSPFIVDRGTYTYTYPRELRDLLRSSALHNTVTVDGISSSIPGEGSFSWRTTADAETAGWFATDDTVWFHGRHDGYRHLADPVRHERSVLYRRDRYWVLRDRIRAAGAHVMDSNLHFAPEVSLSLEGPDGQPRATAVRPDGRRRLHVIAIGRAPDGSVRTLAARLQQTRHSRAFGELCLAPTLELRCAGTGDLEILTFLIPLPLVQSAPHLETAMQGDEQVYRVSTGTWEEELVIPLGDAGSSGEVSWHRTRHSRRPDPSGA